MFEDSSGLGTPIAIACVLAVAALLALGIWLRIKYRVLSQKRKISELERTILRMREDKNVLRGQRDLYRREIIAIVGRLTDGSEIMRRLGLSDDGGTPYESALFQHVSYTVADTPGTKELGGGRHRFELIQGRAI